MSYQGPKSSSDYSHQASKKQKVSFNPINKSVIHLKWNTKGATEILKMLMKICMPRDSNELKASFPAFEGVIHHHKRCLIERNEAGLSFLDLACTLPGLFNEDKSLIEAISETLFPALWKEMEDTFTPSELNDFLKYGPGPVALLYHAISSRSESLVKMVLSLLAKKGLEAFLFNKASMLLSMLLIQAVRTQKIGIILQIIDFFKKNNANEALLQNLEARTEDGFMILQEALLIKSEEIVAFIASLLKEVKDKEILKQNLNNVTQSHYYTLHYAINSGSLNNVALIIKLCEENLQSETWRKMLRAPIKEDNYLVKATNSGQVSVVESVISAFKRAFRGESVIVMRKLLEQDAKYLKYRETIQAWNYLALFLPFMEAEEFKSLIFQANIALYLTFARKARSEALFNEAFDALSHVVPRKLNQLVSLNEHGWSSFNYIFFNIYKDQKNGELAKKYAGLIFDLFFAHLQKLSPSVIKKTLGNRTNNGIMLLQQVLTNDFGEVFDKLVDFLSQKEYEALLCPQLENRNKEGNCILQTAIYSGVESNIDKIVALLLKPEHEKTRELNLINRNDYGDMVLMVALGKSRAIKQKVISLLSLPENRQVLLANLRNLDNKGLNIFQLAVNFEDSVDWLFDLMVLAYGEDARAIIGAMISDKEFRKDSSALFEFYNTYSFPVKEVPAQYDFPSHIKATESHQIDSLEHSTTSQSPSDFGIDVYSTFLDSLVPLVAKASEDRTNQSDQESDQNIACSNFIDGEQSTQLYDNEVEEVNEKPLNYVKPCGGIHAKYLGGALPHLPEPLPDSDEALDDEAETKTQYQQILEFKELKSLLQKNAPSRKKFTLKSLCIQASFYTTKGTLNEEEQVTFIIAGRKELALVPDVSQGRCVLVLTAEEYKFLEGRIPAQYDILALESLKSETHGTYEKLGLPTCRRLAAFFFAHYADVETFLMLDDNIKKLKFNAARGRWHNLYRLIEKQLADNLCVSVQTDSFWAIRPGELGSKMFMINMADLKDHLPLSKQLFTLFPQASNAHYWGEDYHFQLGLHLKMRESCQGYQILDRELVCLVRSAKNRNIFAQSGILAKPFDALPDEDLQKLSHTLQAEIKELQALLNGIIHNNMKHYQRKKRAIQKADLQLKHAFANRVEAEGELVPLEAEDDFMSRYQSLIRSLRFKENVFRYYQHDAIKSIAETNEMETRLLLPTGSGKTFTQCELIRMAFHCAKEAEHIIVVTPYIDLVNQFYNDFIDFNQKETALNMDLRIPPEAIVKVCSHQQSCHLKALLMNKQIKKQISVLIFCADSFNKFLEEMEFSIPHVPLIMLDEYHYYPSLVGRLVEELAEGDPLVVGSTATPLANDPLTHTAFTYQRARGVREGFLAPVIADTLGADYSTDSVAQLISCLPLLLSTQYHPGFEQIATLANTKGVVYLPSINDCNRAEAVLAKAQINCYSIHSQNKEHKADLQAFLESAQPGVLLAVRMLRIGFNAKDLAWVIIAQNGEDTHEGCSNMEQMIGRVMRFLGSKIGYVLCFDNVYQEIIRKLLADQPLTLPVSPDYLAQAKGYKLSNNKWQVTDIPDECMEGDRLKKGICYPFCIIPKTIRNFSITALPSPEVNESDDSQAVMKDVIDSIEFGVKDNDLFAFCSKRHRSEGALSKALTESTGKLYDWLMEETPSAKGLLGMNK